MHVLDSIFISVMREFAGHLLGWLGCLDFNVRFLSQGMICKMLNRCVPFGSDA